ncbi:MAG: GNAT family N-acetyltransferase [Anaerolineae bacterium]|nr:GNAT family N-acetyltransferase [Anaerolineae bacterium]
MTDLSHNILRGSRLCLDAITEDDLSTLNRWHQDAGFMRLLDARPAKPRAMADLREDFYGTQRSANGFVFAIRLLEGDTLIGWLELDNILWTHRVAGIGAGLGSPEHRGQGYGTEACQLGLRFAFEELNLHRITGTVFSYNTASLRMVEKLGFVREGVFREFLERGGQRHDMILFGLLRPEWLARQKQRA